MPTPRISVVIPVFNEVATVSSLLKRLDAQLVASNTPYEMIVVDDHSTDGTLKVLESLKDVYPLTVMLKNPKERRGKAFSLLAGFAKAQGEILVMIDGDLQYPPEAIPAMLKKLDGGVDIVVAARRKQDVPFLRRCAAGLFQSIVARGLHGLDVDAQSGLKVIRAEIISRLTLHPSATSFDVELLVKALQAGYTIATVPVSVQRRQGKSRLNLPVAAIAMIANALSLKLKRPDVIPFSAAMIEAEGQGFHYNTQKYIPHSQLPVSQTALYRLDRNQRIVIFVLLLLFIGWVFVNWHAAIVTLVAVLTILYFVDLLFNFYLIYRSFSMPTEIKITSEELAAHQEAEWPTYTIFCPLYKEPEVIPQFIKAIGALDYPKDKLQVMLLLESDDTATIAKAKTLVLPSYMETVVVPHSLPKTKPKACNYGLLSAKGEYCVIYDAEDVPDVDQLKKAVLAFKKAGKRVACVQAKLNFYNPHQNILTRAFTMEYSLWFDLVLTGLQSIHAPIPLGGTSNHFRTDRLREIHGWDGFNVTEDCDLGMRLVKHGYLTAILDSITLEEANSDLLNWFNQRSRWIKGYMQTYLVHMRRPKEFITHWYEPHVVTFQLVVGGKILSMFINPLMWAITISYFVIRPIVGPFIESFFPTPIFYMGIFSFIFGNFLYMYYYMIGCVKREQDELVKYALFVPFYWLAMSMAAWKATRELIVRPHHWAKTQHGLHLNNKKAMKQTTEKIGVRYA